MMMMMMKGMVQIHDEQRSIQMTILHSLSDRLKRKVNGLNMIPALFKK